MKLCKKKIVFLSIFCALIIIMIFVLCSFTPPSYSSSVIVFSSLNFYEVDSLISVALLQYNVGAFNSFIPLCIVFSSRAVTIYFTTLPYGSSYSSSVSGNTLSFTGFSTTYFMHFCEGGFSFFARSTTISFDLSTILAYWPSYGSEIVRNDDFPFSSVSDPNSDYISDALSYWIDYFNLLNFDPSELDSAYESGYYDGLESGLVWGEELGYQEGYTEGYQEGIGTGYAHGYLAGEAAGYDTGYADGYQDGYETGYDSGYAEAERETVIEYVEPIEIDIGRVISGISSVPDNIMNGSFDFELFGINVYGLLKLLIILFVVSAIVVFIIKRAS